MIAQLEGERLALRDDRWYEKFVPVADRLYEQHLEELRKEEK